MRKMLNFTDNKIIAGKNFLARKLAGQHRTLTRGDSQLFTTLGLVLIAALILGLLAVFGKDIFKNVTEKVGENVNKLFTPPSTPPTITP